MSESHGWIKLHRQLLDSAPYQDENPLTLKVWIECLVRANHAPSKFLRAGKQLTLEPGDFVYSRPEWAKRLKCRTSTLRNILSKLENWDMIKDRFKDRGIATVYQVKNWNKYQHQDNLEDNLEDMERTWRGHGEDTQKNEENGKNARSIQTTPSVPAGVQGGRSEFIERLQPDTKRLWKTWERICPEITTDLEGNRSALNKLLEIEGSIEKVERLIALCAKAWDIKYCPKEAKASSPKALWEKRATLLSWGKGAFTQEKEKEVTHIPSPTRK